MAFSDKILILRKERAWSQERLSEELNVSRQAISKWESGLAMPDLAKLQEISLLFGMTLDDLVNDEKLPSQQVARQNEAQGSVPDVDEHKVEQDKPVSKKRFSRKLWFVPLVAIIIVVAAVAVFWNPAAPDYTQPEAIAEYLTNTINLQQPYSQIYLSDLLPEQIRAQMENDGIRVSVTNDVLEQARRLFMNGYFLSFEDYGLLYAVDEDALYLNGRAVSYFEDYSVESTLARIAWIGETEEMAFVVVERNHRGDIVSVEDLSLYE